MRAGRFCFICFVAVEWAPTPLVVTGSMSTLARAAQVALAGGAGGEVFKVVHEICVR